MNGPLFFAVMMAVVLAFGIAMFWQESKRMTQKEVIYGVEDSIEYVWAGLGEDRHGLTKDDIRRILEWEMFYLQQPDLWENEGPPVVGGVAAATFAQERSFEAGYSYEPEQIFAVLNLQSSYLEAIGAIGTPADPEELT
jgi:hypothetical protein